jgi:farnesol dehydrogenase
MVFNLLSPGYFLKKHQMTTLVTGATGYIGTSLVLTLADQGKKVRALVRSESKCQAIAHHPNIELVKGDLTDAMSLSEAIKGCKEIYHLAAFAGIWAKDLNKYHYINVEGTKKLLMAAIEAGTKRVVITSTAGVMGPCLEDSKPIREDSALEPLLFSPYDRSKYEEEKAAFRFLDRGIDVVIVNPSRIYGPGLKGVSNSVSKLVDLFNQGKWRFIPGNGSSQGNYVYIDDVVSGHMLAMQKGTPGERYILGGENISYNDFFALLKKITGRNQKLIKAPKIVLLFWAYLEVLMANLFGKSPMVVPAFVHKLSHNWKLSSEKAVRELGYDPIDLETGLNKTLEWINHE